MHLFIILSHHLFTFIVYFQNQLKLLSIPSTSRASTLTFMPMENLSESDLTSLATTSSPAPSLSESESRFCYSDKIVLQPRIDSAFKHIKSFEGNIYI